MNEFIYSVYEQAEIDHSLKVLTQEIVSHIANEVGEIETKFERGSELDTNEIAEKIMIAVVDEVSERIKSEARKRIDLARIEK